METKEILNEYKEKICPHCIHHENKEYTECNIVIQIDGQADCINYKCKDYFRRRKNEENKILSKYI